MLVQQEVEKACIGVACVVSALQGLRDVIVDTQGVLLRSAVATGVARFIPSDYSVDFTSLPRGTNRNFDLRREFHDLLIQSPIRATSIYNGAFADILGYGTPLLNFRDNTVGYWGDDPDWHLDFTTTDDTAAFTAAAAMDASAPPSLHIASFQVSPVQLCEVASEVTSKTFTLVPLGSLEAFAAHNRQERAARPESEKEMYPRWQSGQYMHDMFCAHHETLDNERYPDLEWTSAEAIIGGLVQR
jgi:hypothetical protein